MKTNEKAQITLDKQEALLMLEMVRKYANSGRELTKDEQHIVNRWVYWLNANFGIVY